MHVQSQRPRLFIAAILCLFAESSFRRADARKCCSGNRIAHTALVRCLELIDQTVDQRQIFLLPLVPHLAADTSCVRVAGPETFCVNFPMLFFPLW